MTETGIETAAPALLLSAADVRAALPMAECVDVMDEAFRALALGGSVQPLRSKLAVPDSDGMMGLMPAWLAADDEAGRPPLLGFKVFTLFPGNPGSGLPSLYGFVLLFDGTTGRPLALLDGASLTALRTAAVSGLATRLLAVEDAAELAILGSGVQAESHLEAMLAVRPVERARVWSRSAARAAMFSAAQQERWGLEIVAAATAREAVEGAAIVCTVTSAESPVLSGEWLAPGAHVNAVGAHTPGSRELDTAAIRRAAVYVDRLESALAESGEILLPLAEGAIAPEHVRGELAALVSGRLAGRRDRREITVFVSLGLAIEDLAAGYRIYRTALERGLGRSWDPAGPGPGSLRSGVVAAADPRAADAPGEAPASGQSPLPSTGPEQ